ncbi:MAG: LamG-like jellyroll fold domain-containing protein [Planctomycetota bacterium]
MDDSIRQLIYQAVDETISAEDFEKLQQAIERIPEVRAEYLQAVRLCESLRGMTEEAVANERIDGSVEAASQLANPAPRIMSWSLLAFAATILIITSSAAYWLGKQGIAQVANEGEESLAPEIQIAGHATLRYAVDVVWPSDSPARREGDVLSDGPFAFDEGVAEIDFFCGAALIVEGPANLDIESDWAVRVTQGRIRATVPPAARGFIVKVADSEIVDLGTEFAVEVGADNAQVEVIEGEVKLRGGELNGKHLLTGDVGTLQGTAEQANLASRVSTRKDIASRQRVAEKERIEAWMSSVLELQSDKRLIAYYPIGVSQSGRTVRNVANDVGVSDGLLVGPVDHGLGRFGATSKGLRFDRPGARVRTRIDGEFSAFTFACWVRIDSLEHRYNALFMADSYETGEPHWQIRDDGRLMFSVMVDDTQEVKHFNERDQKVVRDAGLHRVYYTEPVWDHSKSGQWFHLVAVYDPAKRRVTQYVNGKRVASEQIVDKFYISSLKIGAAEIGNWGQPFRDSAWFAVRNLNGTIDEMALFNAAFESKEVDKLYQQGKPLGY